MSCSVFRVTVLSDAFTASPPPSPLLAGVWEYIETTRDQVRDLERRVRLAKENVDNIQKIMEEWSQTSLYQRKEDKNNTLLNLEVRNFV